MILRKPYAFLIKHFRLIHIIIFVILGYLIFPLRKIYLFFRNYVASSSFVYTDNIVSEYVTFKMFLLILIVIIMAFAIYILIHKKKKPIVFYIVLILYCFALLGTLIYFRSFFVSLQYRTYTPLDIVVLRDISLGLYIINFFYVLFAFIRGFGFDLKKFSFDKDLKELNLDESDNEEYEFSLNIDKDNIKSYFHRQRREMGYFFKENAKTLILLFIPILLILGAFGYYTFFVKNKVYQQDEIVYLGKVSFKVNNCFITNKDKNNEIISKKSSFLILDLNIQNNGAAIRIDKDILRVNYGDNYRYANSDYQSYFDDLGTVYDNQIIENNTNQNYIFIFKCDGELKDDFYFELLKNRNNLKYYRMLLRPTEKNNVNKFHQLNEELDVLNNKFKITKFDIIDSDSYKYEDCYNEKCQSFTKIIFPKAGEQVLVLNMVSNKILEDSFYENYFILKDDDDNLFTNITFLGQNQGKIYFSVSQEILAKDVLILVIKTRDVEYNILLKGEIIDE